MANSEKKEFIFGSQFQRDERPSPSQQASVEAGTAVAAARASVWKGKLGAERLKQRRQEPSTSQSSPPSDVFPPTRSRLINLSKKAPSIGDQMPEHMRGDIYSNQHRFPG